MAKPDDPGQKASDIVPVETTTPSARGDMHRLFVQTLSEAQVDFLLQRTPKHEVKMRQGRGGMQFAYVEHGYVTERLNLVFGFNWDFEVLDRQILDDEVLVEARLTVRTPAGQTIVKTQFGGAEIKRHASGTKMGKPLSVADDLKAAASDALKKCASLLGIGLDLYGRDRPEEAGTEPEQETAPAKSSGVTPIGVRPGGLSLPRQLEEIVLLAREARMPIPDLQSNLGVASLDELTEARAQRVIERLRKLASGSRAQAS